MILLLFFSSDIVKINKIQNEINNLIRVFFDYKSTKNERLEKDFLKMYSDIRPVGVDIYIQYLILKKNKNKIKDEMNYAISILDKGIEDTIREKYIGISVFNALSILKDDGNFYHYTLEFFKIFEKKKWETIRKIPQDANY